VLGLLASPAYPLRLYDGLWVWTRFNLPRVPTLPALVATPRVLAVLAASGLLVAAAGGLRGPRAAGRDAPALAAWALVVAWGVAVYVMVASYDGHGGRTHPRYLFPAIAGLAVTGALGLDRLPGARRGLWVLGPTLAQLALTAAAWAAFVTALRGHRPGSPADLLGAVAAPLAAGGVRWPWALLALAGTLLAAAVALLGLALARLAPRTRERPGGGADEAWKEEVHADRSPRDRAPTP
jgi:hypothetical protein